MSFLSLIGNGFTAQPNPKRQSTRTATDLNPSDADLRVFKTGACYPSVELANRFNLQYQPKDSENKGFGFDIIDSRSFPNTQGTTPAFIMIAPVSKDAGKVDLFNQVTYDEDGLPIGDVLTQGSANPWFVEMLKEVYGITMERYVDLKLVKVDVIANQLQEATNGIYYVPKHVVRGPRAGSVSIVRRENLDMYVLMPASLLGPENAEISSSTENNTVTEPVSKITQTQDLC